MHCAGIEPGQGKLAARWLGTLAALAEPARREVTAPQVGQVAGDRSQGTQVAASVGRGGDEARGIGMARMPWICRSAAARA